MRVGVIDRVVVPIVIPDHLIDRDRVTVIGLGAHGQDRVIPDVRPAPAIA